MRHPYLGDGHAEEVGGEVREVLAGEGELRDAGAGQLGQQLDQSQLSTATHQSQLTWSSWGRDSCVLFRSRSSARVTAGTSVAAPTWQYDDMTRTLALVSTLTSARGTESRLRVVILCTEARARSTASSWSRVRWQYLATWQHGDMVTTCPDTCWHTSSRSS